MKKLVLALVASGFCLSALAAPVPTIYNYVTASGSCSDPNYYEDATGSFVKYALGASSMAVCDSDDNQCMDVALQGNAFSMRDDGSSIEGTIKLDNNNTRLVMHTVDSFLPFEKSKILKKKTRVLSASNAEQPIVCTYDTVYQAG